MWTTRRWRSWTLPVLLAAALALSACAQLREALVEKPEPGCPGTITMVHAVATAMNHADQWGITYDPETVEVVWLPDAWVMEFQLDPGGTGAIVSVGVTLDGRMLYCQAEKPCFWQKPLFESSCPVPPEQRISRDEALRTGRLYLYRQKTISNAQQPVRINQTGDARWVVFFTGGPEKDRKFTIEVSPEGKVTKFIEGI